MTLNAGGCFNKLGGLILGSVYKGGLIRFLVMLGAPDFWKLPGMLGYLALLSQAISIAMLEAYQRLSISLADDVNLASPNTYHTTRLPKVLVYQAMQELHHQQYLAPPTIYPLRHPKYHLTETIRPSIEVHWDLHHQWSHL